MLARQNHTSPLQWLGRQLFNRDDAVAFFDPLLERINPMWVQEYTPARVQRIIRDTADTQTFVLKPARRWQGFAAGQHVNICVEIDGVRHQRTFSLSSSTTLWHDQGLVTLTIKRLPGGRVTNWLQDQLNTGAVVGISEAFGDFLIPEPVPPILFIAGGSGITPILSQLKTMAAQGFRAPMTLLYFVQDHSHAIAREHLMDLAARHDLLTVKIVTTQGSSEPRYLTDADLSTITDLSSREIFLCGPQGLMALAGELLDAQGVSRDKIHSTYFSAPQTDLSSQNLGGKVRFARSNLEVDSTGDAPLLEIAEAAGLTPQHGCRMGICHQCSCRKTSGTVVNRLTGHASGPGEDTIQLCISVPQGPVSLNI
ncbi:ferredoxin reductase [Marinobacter alexandrii]|jgi:ferredoxin-NADP reductase|uniref:ferredoxin reductase n=1 Tax=Marinobacter alexandrii TaxID=2570351 RepID=UPI002ABDE911|nr:FAD-binding oxidoreductase [Marinobacter alexandrii]